MLEDVGKVVIGVVVGLLFEPIKTAVGRYFDRPKIRVEVYVWQLLRNCTPHAYLLNASFFNDGRSESQLREIELVVNLDKIETEFYGKNRYIAGQDFDTFVIPPHGTKPFLSDRLFLSSPFNNLDSKGRNIENFRNVEIIFKFANHSPLKHIFSEDVNESGDPVILKE